MTCTQPYLTSGIHTIEDQQGPCICSISFKLVNYHSIDNGALTKKNKQTKKKMSQVQHEKAKDTQTETHRQKHTNRDTQTETHKQRHTNRDTQTESHKQRHTDRVAQTETQTDTDRQDREPETDRWRKEKDANLIPRSIRCGWWWWWEV